MGLESISEPDIDLPDEDDEFSDAQDDLRSASASPDTSLPSTNSRPVSMEGGDTEDDPVGPVTPGAAKTSFTDIRAPGHLQKTPSSSTTASSNPDSLDFDDEDDEEWVAPELFTPQEDEYNVKTPVIDPPALVASQATITRETSESSQSEAATPEKRRKKSSSSSKRRTARKPTPPQQFPFPATQDEDEDDTPRSPSKRVPQMRTAVARDGGRTQSGGIRGVPTSDTDDF